MALTRNAEHGHRHLTSPTQGQSIPQILHQSENSISPANRVLPPRRQATSLTSLPALYHHLHITPPERAQTPRPNRAKSSAGNPYSYGTHPPRNIPSHSSALSRYPVLCTRRTRLGRTSRSFGFRSYGSLLFHQSRREPR